MRLLLHILLATLLLLGGVGCSGFARRIGPPTIERIERLGSSGVEISLLIPNRSGKRLTIHEATIYFYYKGTPLATAELRGKALIEKRCDNHLTTRWKVEADDPAALLLLEKRISESNFEALSIDYRAQVQIGAMKKTFSAEQVPLCEILYNFVPTK